MRKRLRNTLIPHHGNSHVPHVLSRKAVFAALSLVAIVELSLLAGPMLFTRLQDNLAAVLPAVVTVLTNEARAEESLPGLTKNDLLTQAAQAKADDMASKGYFAHQSPDGTQPWQWIERAGYRYQYAGENLAVNFTDSEEVVEAWQKSPTHNLNLMGARYTDIGVAVAEGRYKGRKAVFVVQMFATPAAAVPVPVAAAPSVITPVAPAPTEPEVLAVEAPVAESPVLGSSTEAPSSVSLISRIVSSPRTYGTYSLLVLAALFLSVLVVSWGKHHPRALANGAIAVGVLAVVIFANKMLLLSDLSLPRDAQNAATALHALDSRTE